jgi:hypothetical protein
MKPQQYLTKPPNSSFQDDNETWKVNFNDLSFINYLTKQRPKHKGKICENPPNQRHLHGPISMIHANAFV